MQSQQQDEYQGLDDSEILKRVYYTDMKNRQLEGRIAQLEPYKQREIKKTLPQKHTALFDKYQMGKFAIKLLYIGTNYNGVEFQAGTGNTIQGFLFRCLYGLSLIDDPAPKKDFSRAARTDRGVSAFGNVVALNLRTSVPKACSEQTKFESKQLNDLSYVKMMNSILPQDIRVLAVKRVDQKFNARYQCHSRSYRYFFTKNFYDIEAMRRGIAKFRGKHNFINFCKMDITSTVDFEKVMLDCSIQKADLSLFGMHHDERCEVYNFHFVANSFLWHQIRYMVTILFLVGLGKESENIIDEMLDTQRTPSKPNYPAASEFPLLLSDCEFPNLNFQMARDTSVNTYNTLNTIIMSKVLNMTLYVNCMMVMKGWALKCLALNQDSVVQLASEVNRKKQMSKNNRLQFKKSTGLNYQQKKESLKGKQKVLHQKKIEKRKNYQAKLSNSLCPDPASLAQSQS